MKQAAERRRMDLIKNEARVEVIGEAYCNNRKRVLCIDTGEIFASVTDAGKYFKCHPTLISAVCNGKPHHHTVKGKRFCFVGGGTNTDDHLEEIVKKIKKNEEESSKIRIKAEKYDQMMNTVKKIKRTVTVMDEAIRIVLQAKQDYENFTRHLAELEQEA
jgi:hypothetical protein